MSKNLWEKIEDIFPLVADLPEAERESRLRELCAGDDDLRREILALLAADKKAADFCESPAALPDSLVHPFPDNQPPTLELTGEKFGAYRVVRKIGAGGMGAVYLAVRADGAFHKEVAVKLVKNGADTEFNLRRFRHERQILARLEHPNIARLLDGGATEAGAPYFVMEYIEGKPLFDYCAEKGLDLSGRLQLFRQICAAVDYAHKSGVIHRDLKPGNILVTANGLAKLLDFGIAKIFDEDLVQEAVINTVTLMRQLTPEYASPEQIKGENITPASDVYSLGVILYQLLTGGRPYKFTSRAPHEIARVICEEKIQVPQLTANSLFSDELSFIILKALRKQPSARYASVDDLSRDIEKFLAGLPADIAEAPPLLFEQSASSLSGAKAISAVTNQLSGEQPFSAHLTNGILRQLNFKKRAAAVAALTLISLIGVGGFVAYKNRKVEKPPVVAGVNQDLTKTIVVLPFAGEIDQDHALGNGLAYILTSKLGRVKKLAVRSGGVELANKTPQEVGQVLNADFVVRGAIKTESQARQLAVELVNTRSGEIVWKYKFVVPDAHFIGLQSRIAEQIVEALMVELSPQERAQILRRDTESGEAYALYLAGRHKLASRSKPGMEEAIKLFNLAAERDPNFALAYSGLADVHILIVRFGKIPAQTAYQKAEEYAVKALALDPDLAEARVSLAMSRYRRNKDTAEAERNFRRAIELNPSLATAHHWYSLVLSESGRLDESLREMKTAAELDPRSVVIHFGVGTIYHKLKQYDDAIVYFDKAIEIDNGFVSAYTLKSLLQQFQGDYDGALETYRKARIFGGNNEREPLWMLMQAQVHAAKGRKTEAFEVLNRFYKTPEYRKIPTNFALDIALVHHLLGDDDQAFLYLEKLKLKDKKEVEFVTTDPRFAGLHNDPRFTELKERWQAKI